MASKQIYPLQYFEEKNAQIIKHITKEKIFFHYSYYYNII
jgi:hypothetical protein